jgi:hypothetical protein
VAYPNPASDELSLSLERKLPEPIPAAGQAVAEQVIPENMMNRQAEQTEPVPLDVKVQLISIKQVVWSGQLVKGQLTFSTAGLPNGSYYLKSDKDEVKEQLIIIQH